MPHDLAHKASPEPQSLQEAVKNRGFRSESARRIRRVISTLLRRKPFFGTLALPLVHVEDPKRKTIASDGHILAYNSEWVKRTSADKLETAIARICLSLALKHHTRRNDREYARWQMASQAVTLSMLQDEDFAMPEGDEDEGNAMFWAGQAADKSVESMYELIPPGDDEDDGEGDGQGQGGMGAGASGQDPNQQPQAGDGQGQGQGQEGENPPSSDPSGTGETMDSPAKSEEETREEEQRWDHNAHQADRIAKAEGRGSANISEMLEESHKRRMSWREILRQFMQESAKNDYTWMRPNRRHIDGGLYLPSVHGEAMPPVVFAIDSSASVASEMLAEFWSELRGIVEETSPIKVVIIQCDTRVQEVVEYEPTALPEALEAKGRGGTQFSPVWDAVADHGVDPCACIFFSDMECSDFGEAPDYPVLWADWLGTVASGRAYTADGDVPFGQVLDLSEAVEDLAA